MGSKPFIFRFADVEVREREFSIVKAGDVLSVEPKAFRVLLILLRNAPKLITKEELLNAVWGDAAVTENSLTRSIALLRRLLGDDIRNPQYIETVATVGYRFVSKVEVSEDALGDLEAARKANDPVEENFVGTLTSEEITETVNPSAPAERRTSNKGMTEKLMDGRRNRPWNRVLLSAVLLLAGLIAAVWYLRRPLPPLRVTEYTQITHDGRPKEIAATDGNRLYFNRNYDPQRIAQVAISGGEIAPVSVALPLPWINDVSPDGSALLVTSIDEGRGSLWNVEVPAGSPRRLLTDVGVISAAWSPDWGSVVYTTDNGELYLMRSDGTGNRKLAALGGAPGSLSWSPDGNKIRFSRNNRLWEVLPDGTGLRPLLPDWRPSSPQCCGRWTPDGKFFVFLSGGAFFNFNKRIPGSQLWALDERHGLFRRAPTEPVQLTSGPTRWYAPIPSKDGTKIFAQGVTPRGELVRFDAQSGRFQSWLGGISAEGVTFSRDGKFIAYVTFPEGILWKADPDGSNPIKLTDAPLYPFNPLWSPDSSQILFSSYDSEGHRRLYVISSQGGISQALLPEDNEAQSDPSWSSDGKKIVFATLETFGTFNSVLRILDLASHKITTIPGSEGVWSPRWSPNGRFIAALYTGDEGLKIFDLATQRWSTLRTEGCNYPTWSLDSQFIYFLLPVNDPGIFRVRVTGGSAERVVVLKGFRYTGVFTLWMGLDPQGTPLLLRDAGTDDIYALTLEQK